MNGTIEILRICQLGIGDKFMLGGTWIHIMDDDGEKFKCRYCYNGKSGHITEVGRNSQQFVQVERNKIEEK